MAPLRRRRVIEKRDHTGGFRRGRDPANRELASSATLPFIFTSHLGLRIRTQTERRTQQPAHRTTLQAGAGIRARSCEGRRELYPAAGPGHAVRLAPGKVDDHEMRQVPLKISPYAPPLEIERSRSHSPAHSVTRELSRLRATAPQYSISHLCPPRPQPGTHIRSPTCTAQPGQS